MKKLLFLLLFIPLVSFGQKPVSDKYIFEYENAGRGYKYASGGSSVRNYTIPIISEYLDYSMQGFSKVERLKNIFAEHGEHNTWYDNSLSGHNIMPKNGYFFLDDNPFRDNYRIAIIQSGNYENSIGPGRVVPYLAFIFTKSDKSTLKLEIRHSNKSFLFKRVAVGDGSISINLKDKSITEIKIDLIFNGDPSTLMTIDPNYIMKSSNEIDPNSEIISNLKKYSFVDVKITKSSLTNSSSIFYKVGLKGSTSAINKIIGYKIEPSRKNQFDYIYNMGMANFNPFDYEGYIYKFLEDAKKNHNLNFDYTKNTIITLSKRLEDKTIAVALASNDDNKVAIAIDPESWQKASQPKRWYIIYHELGHDILNLEHGECGAMMNEYAKPDYTWSELEKDKTTMFESYKRLKQN